MMACLPGQYVESEYDGIWLWVTAEQWEKEWDAGNENQLVTKEASYLLQVVQ